MNDGVRMALGWDDKKRCFLLLLCDDLGGEITLRLPEDMARNLVAVMGNTLAAWDAKQRTASQPSLSEAEQAAVRSLLDGI